MTILPLLATGCARETLPAGPVVATADVQGRVGAAGPGDELRVEFQRLDSPTYLQTDVDAGGWYRAELPLGDYRVSLLGAAVRTYLTPAGAVTTRAAESETLRLRDAGSAVRRDFPLGGLRLVIGGLSALEEWKGQVTLHRLQPDGVSIVGTGAHGATVSGGILDVRTRPAPPGSYTLRLSFQASYPHPEAGYTETYGVASTGDPTSPDTLRVGPDSLTTHEPALAFPGVLTGRITGAWQELGVSPPGLEAIGADGAFACTLHHAQEDGSFRLVLPRARPVKLRVAGSAGTWIGGVDQETATVFTPSPGGAIDGIEHVVSGVLVRPRSEVLLADDEFYRVELHDTQGLVPLRTWSASGGRPAGAYGMPPGTYRVRLVNDLGRSLWRAQWYDRVATVDLAATVVIPPGGDVVVLEPVFERGGEIGGTALAGGAGACGAIITTADASIILDVLTVSARSPAFRWPGLADGRYRVGLYCGDAWYWPGDEAPEGTVWHPGVTDWAIADDLVIIDAGTITGLQLGPAPAR